MLGATLLLVGLGWLGTVVLIGGPFDRPEHNVAFFGCVVLALGCTVKTQDVKATWKLFGAVGSGSAAITLWAQIKWSEFSQAFGLPGGTIAPDASMYLHTSFEVSARIAGLLLVALGILGWARLCVPTINKHGAVGPAVFVAGLIGTLAILEHDAYQNQVVAAEAQEAARGLRAPRWTLGLDLNRVCVRPIAGNVSVEGGPLATDHPMVMFAQGSRVWFWDPRKPSGKIVLAPSVQRGDVTTVVVADGVDQCWRSVETQGPGITGTSRGDDEETRPPTTTAAR